MNKLNIDSKIYFIGIRIAGSYYQQKNDWFDLEKTIIDICYEIPNDGRLLSLLLSWIKIHGNYLIAEKLIKFYKQISAKRGHSPWFNALMAYAAIECSHKFSKWVKIEENTVYFGDKERTISLIEMKESIPFLDKINIKMAKTSLRIREKDVLSPADLIKQNKQYKNRYVYGPSWRADIITAIENGLKNPYQIAKFIGCSYEPANRIFYEYKLSHP